VIVALVLAAGRGLRFAGGARAKQFEEVLGRPLFVHALEAYRRADPAIRRVLVAPGERLDDVRELLAEHGIAEDTVVTPGGESRQQSIRRGVAAADDRWTAPAIRTLILHNAASPNTSPDTIRDGVSGS